MGHSLRSAALCASLCFIVSFSAIAADPAQSLFEQAQTLYAERADAPRLAQARALLDQAEGIVRDSELKYDILILNSRAIYFQGVKATREADKVELHARGEAKAQEAMAIDDQYAEAYYVAALNLARWAEAKGAIASLSRKDDLIDHLEGAKARMTRDLQPGETIDGHGPNRILGRILYKLPAFAGGSRDRSVQLLKVCFDQAPHYSINVWYYAESLAAGSRSERETAKRILDELLRKDPKTIHPERIPESEDEFQEARRLRAQLG